MRKHSAVDFSFLYDLQRNFHKFVVMAFVDRKYLPANNGDLVKSCGGEKPSNKGNL